jgi:hypothetical protein
MKISYRTVALLVLTGCLAVVVADAWFMNAPTLISSSSSWSPAPPPAPPPDGSATRSKSREISGIRVRGSEAFVERTTAAMELLRRNSRADFDEVCAVVSAIEQAERSGTDVQTGRLSLAPASSLDCSLQWYASVLVHEAHHARLYRTEGTERTGDGVFTAEVECIGVQRTALRNVGGNAYELAWLKSQSDGRYPDVNHDGKYDWDDYNARHW